MHATLETLSADTDRLQRHFEAFLDELDTLPLDTLGIEFRSNLLKNAVLMLAKLTSVRKTLVALRVHTDANFFEWKRLGAGLLAMEQSLDDLRAQARAARANTGAPPTAARTKAASSPNIAPAPTPATPLADALNNAPSSASIAAPAESAPAPAPVAPISPAPSSAPSPAAPAPAAPPSASPARKSPSTPASALVHHSPEWFDALYAYAVEPERPCAVISPARFRTAADDEQDELFPRFATAADFNFATLADIYGPPLASDDDTAPGTAELRAALRHAARTLPTLPHLTAPDFPTRLTTLIASTESALTQTRTTLQANFPEVCTHTPPPDSTDTPESTDTFSDSPPAAPSPTAPPDSTADLAGTHFLHPSTQAAPGRRPAGGCP